MTGSYNHIWRRRKCKHLYCDKPWYHQGAKGQQYHLVWYTVWGILVLFNVKVDAHCGFGSPGWRFYKVTGSMSSYHWCLKCNCILYGIIIIPITIILLVSLELMLFQKTTKMFTGEQLRFSQSALLFQYSKPVYYTQGNTLLLSVSSVSMFYAQQESKATQWSFVLAWTINYFIYWDIEDVDVSSTKCMIV